MTYKQQGDQVRIEMTNEEFNKLIFMVGIAAGAASKNGDHDQFYGFLELANQLNAGNPNWQPYETPVKP